MKNDGRGAQMEGGSQLFSISENKYALENELTVTTTIFLSVARRVVSFALPD